MGILQISVLTEECRKSYLDRKLQIAVPRTGFITVSDMVTAPLLFCSDRQFGEVCLGNVETLIILPQWFCVDLSDGVLRREEEDSTCMLVFSCLYIYIFLLYLINRH